MRRSRLISIPLVAGIVTCLLSCNNIKPDVEKPDGAVFQQPTISHLTFKNQKKINWVAIKSLKIKPVIQKLNWHKIPKQFYETALSGSLKPHVAERKIDLNALTETRLHIENIKPEPLKFITSQLPSPKLIKAGPPHLKNAALSLYGLGEAQGLLGSTVTCLLTGHDGLLWIATYQGIYRYDGENLMLYQSISGGYIVSQMLQDARGRIWICSNEDFSEGGLKILDPATMILRRVVRGTGLGNNTYMMLQDKSQKIWIAAGNPGAVGIADTGSLSVKWINNLPAAINFIQGGMAEDRQFNLWIPASPDGVLVINTVKQTIKYLNSPSGLSPGLISAVHCDNRGKVWMGMPDGLINVFDIEQKKLSIYKDALTAGNNISAFCDDNEGAIWTGTNTGVLIIDPASCAVRHLTEAEGMSGNLVRDIKQDNQGQEWVATNKGLNMFTNSDEFVRHIGKERVTTNAGDQFGMLWTGTYSGINIYDIKAGTSRNLNTGFGLSNDTVEMIKEFNGNIFVCSDGGLDIINNLRDSITKLDVKSGLAGKIILTVYQDSNGLIWIGGEKGTLDLYNPLTNTISHTGKIIGLGNASVNDITQDQQGTIWICTNQGIFLTGQKKSAVQYIYTAASEQAACYGSNVFVATVNGLYMFNLQGQTFARFSTAEGLMNKKVLALLNYGRQLFAAGPDGIMVINPPSGNIRTEKDWLTHFFEKRYRIDRVNIDMAVTDCVTRDGLYCWGDNGVTMLNLLKKTQYTPPIYITGMSIMLEPEYFIKNKGNYRDGITWDNIVGAYNVPVNLHLPYNQNFVQFSYVSLNLSPHDTTWFRYKLKGIDDTWNIKTPATSSKSYLGLSPGNYIFEVSVENSGHDWGKPVYMSFTIDPPWWQTWWAYISYLLVFAGIVWISVYFRSLQLIKEKNILEHKIHLRTQEVIVQKEEIKSQRDDLEKAFTKLKQTQNQLVQAEKMASLGELTAGIAHEIQNPLNFINNFSEVNTELIDEMQTELEKKNYEEVKAIARDVQQNQEKINQHGKRADFIVKGMLQHSRTSKGERQLTNINTLADEFFKLSYHGWRAKDKTFNAEMLTSFDKNIPPINVVQQDIGRVFLNLFNNAFYAVNQKIKKAGAGYKPNVKVTTYAKNDQVIIEVNDNGIGIPDAIKNKIMQPFFTTKPSGEGTGLGLSLSYDMVVKGHNGNIQVDSTEGTGSTFIISLPVN